MSPSGADRLQRRFDVGEDLNTLRIEIVRADDLAVAIRRELSRDIHELDALTRVICEYWPSGLPSVLG